MQYFGIFWDLLPGNEKKRLLKFGYPKRNDFFKKRIFTFLEMFGNEMKKRKFKKRKRSENILKNGNENVVSTISASKSTEIKIGQKEKNTIDKSIIL